MKQARSLNSRGVDVPYTLVRNRRKYMTIFVLRDGDIELRVPKRCSIKEAERFLEDKITVVLHKQEIARSKGIIKQLEYNDGSLHFFLGNEYQLQQTGLDRVATVLIEDTIQLSGSRTEDDSVIIKRLDKWYRKQAETVFLERLSVCSELFDQLPSDISVRPWKMKAKWGTCRENGRINLNLNLVKYPLELIDYVLCHELVHLLEFNHSRRFYSILESVMPDYKTREAKLNKLSLCIL